MISATFQVYVDGQLADEERDVGPKDLQTITDTGMRQVGICSAAEAQGQSWQVIVTFSDGDAIRWGTDSTGMITPIEVGVQQLAAAIMKKFPAP